MPPPPSRCERIKPCVVVCYWPVMLWVCVVAADPVVRWGFANVTGWERQDTPLQAQVWKSQHQFSSETHTTQYDVDMTQIDGLVQERHNSIANTLELGLSCTNPSKCFSSTQAPLYFQITKLEANLLFCKLITAKIYHPEWWFRADSRFAPSQWETALLCNDVSHWLGASLESACGSLHASQRLDSCSPKNSP